MPDPDFTELLASGKVRRCPLCGEAIEKNGGCRHMVCPTCRSDWWWTKDGKLEDYEVHQYRLHLQPEEDAALEREMGLEEGEEAPVVGAREAEAVFMRLDVLREQEGGAPVQEDVVAQERGEERGPVAPVALEA